METINGIDFLLAVGVILSSVITWAWARRGEARRAGFMHELLSHGNEARVLELEIEIERLEERICDLTEC
tara:strand:- start:97 stop:306 length:210 start_codon:yes stop_codon:yes gene_type:complete